jgi:hypothetical protein
VQDAGEELGDSGPNQEDSGSEVDGQIVQEIEN